MMYAIKKIAGYYCVVLRSNDLVQFRSACRLNCVDWMNEAGK